MDLKTVSEIIVNFATAAALLFGSAWAYWKWGIPRSRELLSLDGELNCRRVSLHKGIVEIRMLWKNVGVDPFWFNTTKTRIEIYVPSMEELHVDLTPGPKNISLTHVFTLYPLLENTYFVLEPNSTYEFTTPVVLESEFVHLIKWIAIQRDDIQATWDRTFILDVVAPHQESPGSTCAEPVLTEAEAGSVGCRKTKRCS